MSPQVALLVLRLGLALALYLFLGLTLLYLWRDVRAAGGVVGELPQAYLQLLGAPEQGRIHALQSINLIGRAADNTLVLEESTVSAHHARLSYQNGQWWLEDQGSKNGTGVNELEVVEPLVVTLGDRIRIGNVQMVLHGGPAPLATAAAPAAESAFTETMADG